MSMSIYNYQLPYETHDRYDVVLEDYEIHTLVTHSSYMVNRWISTNIDNQTRLVGLDVEWRPSFSRERNPVAILQLCTGPQCLVYQLQYASSIPSSLYSFLENTRYTFMGVGIDHDVEKLKDDYDLDVECIVDLGSLAAETMGQPRLRNAGMKELASVVLGMEVHKPRNIRLSDWDREWLTDGQVMYACLDAFLSYEIGSELYSCY